MPKLKTRSDGFSETSFGFFGVVPLRSTRTRLVEHPPESGNTFNVSSFTFVSGVKAEPIEIQWIKPMAVVPEPVAHLLLNLGHARQPTEYEIDVWNRDQPDDDGPQEDAPTPAEVLAQIAAEIGATRDAPETPPTAPVTGTAAAPEAKTPAPVVQQATVIPSPAPAPVAQSAPVVVPAKTAEPVKEPEKVAGKVAKETALEKAEREAAAAAAANSAKLKEGDK